MPMMNESQNIYSLNSCLITYGLNLTQVSSSDATMLTGHMLHPIVKGEAWRLSPGKGKFVPFRQGCINYWKHDCIGS